MDVLHRKSKKLKYEISTYVDGIKLKKYTTEQFCLEFLMFFLEPKIP